MNDRGITLSPWRYQEPDGWRKVPLSAAPTSPRATLRVVSWNVWFGELAFDQRTDALLDQLERCDADVIALQEMTRARLWKFLDHPWVGDHYTLSDATGGTLGQYGSLLLTRLPVAALEVVPLPSRMGRALLSATLRVGDRQLTVGTVHLESMAPFAEQRREQMGLVTKRLRRLPHDALLLGDMNLLPDEDVQAQTEEFDDVWTRLHPTSPGLTRDPAINVMRAKLEPDTVPARLDRMLLRSPSGGLRPLSIERLGMAPLPDSKGELFTSDHFGLLATFALEPAG